MKLRSMFNLQFGQLAYLNTGLDCKVGPAEGRCLYVGNGESS